MEPQQMFVKMALQSWDAAVKKMTAVFDGLGDEHIYDAIAPGRNRAIYLLGHMVAVHDRMLPLLGFGDRLYPHLDEVFINNPDKVGTSMPAVQELRDNWRHVNELLKEHFQELGAAEWLQRHMNVSDEDFAQEPLRNKMNVLLSRTNHMASHMGQLALIKAKMVSIT
jgi:hypothetical protein